MKDILKTLGVGAITVVGVAAVYFGIVWCVSALGAPDDIRWLAPVMIAIVVLIIFVIGTAVQDAWSYRR